MTEQQTDPQDPTWIALSSMADGAASADEQAHCLALWRERQELRERWHHYHLIGDALRSHEVVRDAGRDARFLRALRARMAGEPVRLGTAVDSPRRTRTWMTALAAAAGVAAVAGVVVVLRPATTEAQAIAARAASQDRAASVAALPTPPELRTVNGQLIRDARLDRYFAAHRQSANGAALQMPGAVVRNVDTIVLENR